MTAVIVVADQLAMSERINVLTCSAPPLVSRTLFSFGPKTSAIPWRIKSWISRCENGKAVRGGT